MIEDYDENLKHQIYLLADVIQEMYFGFVLNTDSSGTYEEFRKILIGTALGALDAVQNKYCDHLEALKKEKLKCQGE